MEQVIHTVFKLRFLMMTMEWTMLLRKDVVLKPITFHR